MEGLTAVLSGGKTIHTESMQFSDCTGTYSETVVRGGDGVVDWFEVTVARERSKTVSMQGHHSSQHEYIWIWRGRQLCHCSRRGHAEQLPGIQSNRVH